MVTIKIFTSTPTWPSCDSEVPKAKRVAAKFPTGEVNVEVYESLSSEGEKYGILFTPTVLVNDRVVATGRGTSEKEIDKFVRQELDKQKK